MQRILTLLTLVAIFALLLNGCSDSSDSPTSTGTTPEDLTPPAAPVSLVVSVDENAVGLAWTENSEVDLDAYRVYRSINTSPYALMATVTQAQFDDTVFAHGIVRVSYVVSAPGRERQRERLLPGDQCAA